MASTSSSASSSSSSFVSSLSHVTSSEHLRLYTELPANLTGKWIGTHDGTFHADESLACYLLLLTDEFKGAQIIRTRQPSALEKCDCLVDVGAVYAPANHRYDHHQITFKDTFSSEHTIRLSSAGLIYKHFGRQIIEKLCDNAATPSELDEMYQKLYSDFIEGMDGIDNGVLQYPQDVKPAYRIKTDLGSRVHNLNPLWNESETAQQINERFRRSMRMCGEEFVEAVRIVWKSYLPARALVRTALENRFKIDSSGEILFFPQATTWKSHLFDLEKSLAIPVPLKYALYQDGSYRIQAVPAEENSFVSRVPLPKAWRGLRDKELSDVSGIDGGVFVHASGFIGGNRTFEGAVEMARKALQIHKQEQSEANSTEQAAKRSKIDNGN